MIHFGGEGKVAVLSAKRWDRRNRADLIESATPCHEAQMVSPYQVSNTLRLIVLASKSEDYTTAPSNGVLKALIQPACFTGAIPWLAFVFAIFMGHENGGNNGQPRSDTRSVC